MEQMEIHIELTNECILKCRHCSSIANSNNDIVEFNQILEFIKKVKNTHRIRLIFTGGEPLLREGLETFLNDIKELNEDIEIGLFTTGLVNKCNNIDSIDIERIKVLKKLGLKFVFISVYSNNGKIHDEITQTESSFNKTIESVKRFINEGIETNINLVLMKKNSNELQEVINYLKSINVNEIRILKLINHGIAADNWGEVGLTNDEQVKIIRQIEKSFDSTISLGGFLEVRNCQYLTEEKKCLAGKNKLYIDNKGNIYPCGAVKLNKSTQIGNINQEFNIDKYSISTGLCMAHRAN